MAITVTMNPRTTNRTKFQPINAQRVTESRQNDNFGLPVSKRPRVGSSPVNNKSAYKFSKQAKSYGTNNAHVTSSGMTSSSVRPAAMTSVGKPLAMTSSTLRPSAMTSSRVTSSVEKPLAMTSSSNVTSSVVNNDFDDDDDFTGAELEEIEMLASQVESQHGVHKQPSKPDKTSTASGSIQFKLPQTSHIRTPSTSNHNKMSMNNDVTLLQQQFNEQEKKIKEMAKLTNQKSGEARVLRDKLKHAENLLFEERQAKILQENEKKEEKIKHENELAKKLEALTDQIAFKEAELKEAESVIKNLSLKNKMVQKKNIRKPERKSSGQPCFPSDDWACTQSSESAKKRIRLVKPESPKVSSNMGKLKRSGSTSGQSKPTPQKQTADQKSLKLPRSKFKMSSTLLKPAIAPSCGSYNTESLILFLHRCNALSNIETFASSPQTTQQTLTNAIEGTKLLLFPSPT
uniref:Uncharacterized protein n=1 Tax=Ciona intestinalis TaxID=7719 RepID=H2XL69_CIOIN